MCCSRIESDRKETTIILSASSTERIKCSSPPASKKSTGTNTMKSTLNCVLLFCCQTIRKPAETQRIIDVMVSEIDQFSFERFTLHLVGAWNGNSHALSAVNFPSESIQLEWFAAFNIAPISIWRMLQKNVSIKFHIQWKMLKKFSLCSGKVEVLSRSSFKRSLLKAQQTKNFQAMNAFESFTYEEETNFMMANSG